MFLKKDMQMKGKLLFVCIVKKLQKVVGIHRMKHLARVKRDIGPCKSIPPYVRFRMKKIFARVCEFQESNPRGI